MTRYSDLLWATDIEPVEAAQVFSVRGERPLWWERSGYAKREKQERPGVSRTWYLLHLVNTPTTEKPVWSLPDDPPAATAVEVGLRAAGHAVVEKAWALRPYEWGEEPHAPLCVELPTHADPEATGVNLPPFRYYTLVVFQVRETRGGQL
jgi:hypothetical protein